MFVMVELLIELGRVWKEENGRVNNMEMHCTCAGRRHNDMH
jgi:hypothetical protein